MADELSSNWVTVRYNEEKFLDFLSVRTAELIGHQLALAMMQAELPQNFAATSKPVAKSQGMKDQL